ncbi:unnamed protein product [Lactuca virosa]|uniref:Cyclin-dependent kinase inhibitor domain-containing protein n=1 Tax=Lactuca virosa TaxID=75947 RepID=A0AAU9PRE3_9ASTR|nr:unnamed protein product [Lactuca virosa]
MGKYMRRKSKTTGEVSLMEVPSLGGVLTRAKTLALQKASAAVASIGAGSYIQLRSRRLVKPTSEKKQKETGALTNPNKASLRGANSSRLKVDEKLFYEELEIRQKTEIKGTVDFEIDDEEGSFGENMVEMEGRGRSTRETTPCSLIRNPDIIRTPGSSTKPNRKNRVQNTTARPIPSTTEMDEFFTEPEKHQQRVFMEKYNFDPVNEKPLNGRYEWLKVDDAIKKS